MGRKIFSKNRLAICSVGGAVAGVILGNGWRKEQTDSFQTEALAG